jgi:hypothetical protein
MVKKNSSRFFPPQRRSDSEHNLLFQKRHLIILKRDYKHLDLRTKEPYWIIGKHSPLSLSNKLLIYKAILKPAWSYGIEL